MIAPKLSPMLPKQFMKPVKYQITTYFPEEAIWYYWYDRVPVVFQPGQYIVNRTVTEDEQGIYVRGGSIIVTLINEGKRLSIN
jgi:hypothetical protein